MLEIRIERLLTRDHHNDGGLNVNTRYHGWHRCGRQLKPHDFIKLDISSADRAQDGTVLRVHEDNKIVEAICMNLVVDVTRQINNLFVRLEVHSADRALTQLVVDSKQVDHSFTRLVSHLGDELGAVTFLLFDSCLLLE